MPLVTGIWTKLDQSSYESTKPWDGTFLHFVKSSSRSSIDAQVVQNGWSGMIGVYVSGSGDTPDIFINRSQFPLFPIPSAPTLAIVGATGSTAWGYKIVPRDSVGGVVGATGLEGKIANGRATLNNANFITVSWATISGAASYDVYLTTGPIALGKVATVTTASFQHKGVVGDGSSAPVVAQTSALTQWIDDQVNGQLKNGQGDQGWWFASHVWNYKADGSYAPRTFLVGDYDFQASDNLPSASWWKE